MNSPEAAPTLSQFVYERLRADLKDNRFAPGEPLRIDVLKTRYRVGISPLREALIRLAETGLVSLHGQRGFRVAEVALENLPHIIDARRFYEVRAFAESIAQGGQRWEDDLVVAFHRLKKLSSEPPSIDLYERWEQGHAAFHAALIGGCGNAWLLRNWGVIFDQAERYRRFAGKDDAWFIGQIPDHEDLLDAALKRDSERGCALLQNHIGRSSGRLIPRLEQVLHTSAALRALKQPQRRGASKTRQKLLELSDEGET